MKLNENEIVLLNYINDHKEEVLHTKLSTLCKKLFLSETFVIRFCQKLGYKGYNEFKFSLKSSSDHSNDTILKQELSKYRDIISSIDLNPLIKTALLIEESKQIYIYGSGISEICAHYLYGVLSSLDIPCIFLNNRDLLDGISINTNSDTLIIIVTSVAESSRYKNVIIKLKENNSKIVWFSPKFDEDLKNKCNIAIYTKDEPLKYKEHSFNPNTYALIQMQVLIELLNSKKFLQ